MEIIIDAKNKSLGRIASETAVNLRSKRNPGYLPNILPKNRVKVINLSGAKITGKKIKQKYYKRYSGYPGNLKHIAMEKLWKKNPKIVFKNMVRGMLPKNKMRKEILKNLSVEL
jgi:large subunit ribosomal protein L13